MSRTALRMDPSGPSAGSVGPRTDPRKSAHFTFQTTLTQAHRERERERELGRDREKERA